MLSSEHPSGPSCSSKSAGPGVRADPATSVAEEPASQDPKDLVQPYPKFSIRDYVFASRSKGIKRSWPFHPRSLQLCLKHGVKDPLPPFEPPDLIRSQLIRSQPLSTFTDVEQSAVCSEAIVSVGLVKSRDAGSSNEYTGDINFQSCQPVDESLGPSPYTSPEDGKSGIDQVGSTNESDHTDEAIPIDLQDNSFTKASRRTEFAAVPLRRLRNLNSSCQPSEKKCKFVVKLGAPTDIRRAEDIASNSSSVSDPMASKTCPVCKVFASTSNTTLNAHIDQCLSAESNTELVETVLVKPKVKPRKKLLMVDIYKTALPFTLEDLDRRNGTNWAVELAVSPVSKEVCTAENRSPEVVSFDRRDDEREGDVYVDSNGIKIRILSKCNDAPLVSRDDLGARKVVKHGTGKGILMSKKMLKSNILKNKKLKMHGKKYNKTSHLNSQVQAYPHDDINEETSEEERNAWNPSESTSNCGSRTVRQWVCSKRSINKSLRRNLSAKTFDKVTPGAHKSVRSSMLGFNDSQVPESPTGMFSSESPEDMATTSEGIDIEQSNGPSKVLRSIPTWSSKTHLQSSVMPKVPRSAAALAKRKIKEIGRREATKLDNYDIVRNPTSAKRSEARSLSFSTAGPSNGSNRLASTSKKIRKHRSPLRIGKRAFSPSSTRFVNGYGEEHEPDTRHVNKKFRVTNTEGHNKFLKHTEEDTADNDFSVESDMPVSGQQNDQYDVAQETEDTQMDCEGEEPETDVPYDSVSRSDPADCCNQTSDVSLSPENNRTADDVLVEGYSVPVEDPNSSVQLAHVHESNSAANNEMDEWQIDPSSTKESSPCLTSNRDLGPGGPQDTSSITSNGENSNKEHGLPLGRDSLDSPISTASTLPPPDALKDSRINEEEPGPSTGRTVEEQITGSLSQETKSLPMAREGEQLPNEKPFCCSCRDTISRESHQSAVGRPVLNFTGKQVPQLHIGSRAPSSFSTYQRTSTKPNPCLDSHGHLLAAKVSAESAINLPSYATNCLSPSLQTQLPSPSNPILRLMGKNLMVMNNEESVHPQAPSSDYILRGNYAAPVGFAPPSYQHLSNSAFINMPPTTASHQIPLPSVQASSFVTPLHGGSVMQADHHSQQKSYRNIMPVMHHPTYMMKEVIVINDSPERRSEPQASMLFPPAPSPTLSIPNNMSPHPFYCLPPQSPILPRERAVGSRPVYANVGPMVGVNSSSQGSQTEVANPYMPNPFFVQSRTGYINPPVYYSQNLR